MKLIVPGRMLKTSGRALSNFAAVVLLSSSLSDASILLTSSWDTDTGHALSAVRDGSTWTFEQGNTAPVQLPFVSPDGPGGHNFLNMVTAGGGGWGNPYYFNFYAGSQSANIFKDPDDLYVRFYFRVHQAWVNSHDDGNTHWVEGIDSSLNTKHYFIMQQGSMQGEAPWNGLSSPFWIEIQNYGDGRLMSTVQFETERWYCYELHVQKIDAAMERWYIRLDGRDITNTYYCIDGGAIPWNTRLDNWYAAGNGWTNEYHATLWINTYDQMTINDGWDVSCVEIRDDRWAGLVQSTKVPGAPMMRNSREMYSAPRGTTHRAIVVAGHRTALGLRGPIFDIRGQLLRNNRTHLGGVIIPANH